LKHPPEDGRAEAVSRERERCRYTVRPR